jgi:dienelactone hydrolase
VRAIALLVLGAVPIALALQPAPLLDESAPPGANYDKAEFRLWYPAGAGPLKAVLVLNPGSNGDGRGAVDDPVWREFAVAHHLALVGTRFTDKPHDQNFIEDYVNVSKGSGQALLDALGRFAARSSHPELANAPLLLWGMSAGGQFDYEFVAWKPDRVIAFVVNKGGVYYSALLPRAARQVPGMLFVGGKDLESRIETITGLFALNRRGGALWALAEEPSAAHVVGRSRDVALTFYEDVLPLRLPERAASPNGAVQLTPLVERAGFLGDLHAKTFAAQGDHDAPNYPTAWLPTTRVAAAWQAMMTETPFEP